VGGGANANEYATSTLRMGIMTGTLTSAAKKLPERCHALLSQVGNGPAITSDDMVEAARPGSNWRTTANNG
jgi:hypothetical protein